MTEQTPLIPTLPASPPPAGDDAAYQAALVRYGSDQVAQPCEYERLFRAASEGLDEGDRAALEQIARRVRPMPQSIAEAWDEWAYIDRRDRVIREFYPSGGVCQAMRARAALLAEAVLSELAADGLEDLESRVKLLAALCSGERRGLGAAQQRAFADTLLRDIAHLKSVLGPGEPRGPATPLGTATERRAAVVAQLCDPETSKWSDRAIAKACGVSPQTVSNWRHKLSDYSEQTGPEARERIYRRGGNVHRMKIKKIGVSGQKKAPDL